MVPNKICRSQNFGDAGCLLDHYCEPGFHGGVPGSREPAGPVRCSGAYRIKPSTGTVWVRPVAPWAEFQGECFRDIGLQPLCNHGAITLPRIPHQDRRTALKDE